MFFFRRALILTVACLFFLTATSLAVPLDTLFTRAKRSISANDYPKAITQFRECLLLAQKQKNWLQTGNAFIGIGIANYKSGNFEVALQNYFNALHAYETDGNQKKQAGTLKNIGNTYRIIKSYDKADSFFKQSLSKFEAQKDSAKIADVLNDIGIMYMDQGMTGNAVSFFKKVVTKYRSYAEPEVRAYAFNNLGICYSNTGNYSASMNFYTASLGLMKQLGDTFGIALVLINIAKLFNRQNLPEQAIQYSKDGLLISQKINSKELTASAFKSMAVSYEKLGDFKQSNSFLNKLLVLNGEIFKDESARSYAEMESRYQNERKQKEIMLLKQENTIKNITLATQRRSQYFLLFILVSILVVVLILYRSYTFKQKLNKELGMLNGRLEEANESKTKLLGIITHDLRSPVSSLFNFLQLQKMVPGRMSVSEQNQYREEINIAAENVLEMMEDLLIWSKSQMERFTPQHEEIDLNDFLDEMVALNTPAADSKNIELIKNCPNGLYLNIDPNFLKIVLRNLLSNAIKFTPSGGTIRLTGSKGKENVLLMIKDTGEGIADEHLPAIFEWSSMRSDSSGLGLKLVKEFTEKLNGKIEVRSAQLEGTTFTLSFPAPES